MKILLGVHQFFPEHRTGTEVLTLELARGLRSRGHDVAVLAGEPHRELTDVTPPWLTQDRFDDIPVYRLHHGHRQDGDPVRPHFDAPERVRLALRVAEEYQPEVVHFNHLRAFSSQVIPALRAAGFPVIFTPTDYWAICPKFLLYREAGKSVCEGPTDAADCLRCLRPMPYWTARLAMQASRTPLRLIGSRGAAVASLRQRLPAVLAGINAAERILPATRFLADMLVQYGVAGEKITVVPYGVDIGPLPPKVAVPPRFHAEAPLRIGFIGSLSEFKGPHVLLEALSRLGECLKAVTLDVYGRIDKDDPYMRALLEQAATLGPGVAFRGTFAHEEIGAVLRRMHVLVVPSVWYESTPLVLCSALAAGTFVMVSRLGGMTEAIVEGQTGLSFAPGEGDALARQLRTILDGTFDLASLPSEPLRRRTTMDYVVDIEAQYQQVVDRLARVKGA